MVAPGRETAYHSDIWKIPYFRGFVYCRILQNACVYSTRCLTIFSETFFKKVLTMGITYIIMDT